MADHPSSERLRDAGLLGNLRILANGGHLLLKQLHNKKGR